MRSLIISTVLAVSVFAPFQVQAIEARRQPSGAIRYYDDQGYDRGYAWCLNGDCRYFDRAQCEGSKIMGAGWCRPNPYATLAGPRLHRQR